MTTCATDGYGAINRPYPPGSRSLTQLDLGIMSLFALLVNLMNVFAISPAERSCASALSASLHSLGGYFVVWFELVFKFPLLLLLVFFIQ